MKQIGLSYLYHYRKRYSYFGHFWQGRYKSLIIDKDEYLITCGRYIELNPIRAKMVNNPKDYRWSSYNIYAYGKKDGMTDIDPLYANLGKTKEERQRNYKTTLQEEAEILNLNTRFLGSESFIRAMEERFDIKNLLNRRGRPKK